MSGILAIYKQVELPEAKLIIFNVFGTKIAFLIETESNNLSSETFREIRKIFDCRKNE